MEKTTVGEKTANSRDISEVVAKLIKDSPQNITVDPINQEGYDSLSPGIIHMAGMLIEKFSYDGSIRRLKGANRTEVKSVFAADYFLSCITDPQVCQKARMIIDDQSIETSKLGIMVSQLVKENYPLESKKMEQEFREKLESVETKESMSYNIIKQKSTLGTGLVIKNLEENTSLEHQQVGVNDALRVFFDGKKYHAVLNLGNYSPSAEGYAKFKKIVEKCDNKFSQDIGGSANDFLNFVGKNKTLDFGRARIYYNEKSRFDYAKSNFRFRDEFIENNWYKGFAHTLGVGSQVMSHVLIAALGPQAVPLHFVNGLVEVSTFFGSADETTSQYSGNMYTGPFHYLTFKALKYFGKGIKWASAGLYNSAKNFSAEEHAALCATAQYPLDALVEINDSYNRNYVDYANAKEAIGNLDKLKAKMQDSYAAAKSGFMDLSKNKGLVVEMESEDLGEVHSFYESLMH